MNMTLKEIFEKKELYQEKELKHYEHNLNLIKSVEPQQKNNCIYQNRKKERK